MKNIKKLLSLLIVVLLLYSCTATEPNEKQIEFSSYQISGCNHLLSLGKVSVMDSCFNYCFNDTLKIDFCIFGNCCPDSNRFTIDHIIKADTLFVSVIDTAARLCHCICNYTIHLELTGLQEERYLFYCNYDSLFMYREYVSKQK